MRKKERKSSHFEQQQNPHLNNMAMAMALAGQCFMSSQSPKMSTTEGNYPEAPRKSQNLREPMRNDNKRIVKVTGVSNFNDVKANKATILSPVAVATHGALASAQCSRLISTKKCRYIISLKKLVIMVFIAGRKPG